ncbi:non-ribosomal peptide synthetase [Chengkuizengella marina]|uniref:non-ribosomal peptide synthetase n=1 Tax=Chengkuizengella marina TaxID=2507566 RepID=UPI00136A94EA|nr:non-ribosomal peptide synthetase [Chengkuizengella marina]
MECTQIEEQLIELIEEVLNIDEVEKEDDFFDLGGDSYDATILLSAILEKFEVEIELSHLFNYSVIEELASFILKHADKVSGEAYIPIKPLQVRKAYDLSSVQKRMYALNQFELDVAGYNVSRVKLIEGEIDLQRFQHALEELVNRHEILRTSFVLDGNEPKQKIHDNVVIELEYQEVSEEEIVQFADQFIRPFDVSKISLLRVALLKCTDERHIFIIDMHHIISDKTSIDIFIRDLIYLYSGLDLPELMVQYKDYASWQNKLYSSNIHKQQEEFWMETLKAPLADLKLPLDHSRPVLLNFQGDRLDFSIEKDMTNRLRQIAKEENATLFMVLLSAYILLWYKYTGQEDIVIGSPASGRLHPDVQEMIGIFINTLPIRTYPQGKKSYRNFLNECRKISLSAFANQQYPFEKIVEKLAIQREMGRNPIFDLCFNMIGEEDYQFSNCSLRIRPYKYLRKRATFDLTLVACETKDTVEFEFEYRTMLFQKNSVKTFVEDYLGILSQICLKPDKILSDFNIVNSLNSNNSKYFKLKHECLSTVNLQKSLINYKATKLDTSKSGVMPFSKPVQYFFEEQAAKHPERVAVVAYGKDIKYGELNKRANQLAKLLRKRGVRPDQVVGLMMDRSIEMITGMLAILKAGGAYLPIDQNSPKNRFYEMLYDSNVYILLTKEKILKQRPWIVDIVQTMSEQRNLEVVRIDKLIDELVAESSVNIESISKADHLAYVIYTSGSTGNPKGVMIEHRNLINLMNGLKEKVYSHHSAYLKISLVASYVFDASVQQIFAALTLGHTLYIVPDDVKLDPIKLGGFYREHDIEISDGTPAHLKILLSAELENGVKIPVKHFLIGGEALPAKLAENFLRKVVENGALITNVYGPAECCVDVTAYTFDVNFNKVNDLTIVPIGEPLFNIQIYILGESGQILPVGVTGELYIGGKGVGRGYINGKNLTDERFVSNPFKLDERMYRTGDLAKWLPNGNIEFQGRIDHQVKIRGYRIELGEVENQILQHPAVREVVVIDFLDASSNKSLVAYLVSDREMPLMEFRDFLGVALPEYMIPSYIVYMASIPLTVNGKVDRQSLPDPQQNIRRIIEYSAPRNEVEKILVKTWQEVLGVEQLGIHDNFFNLGGDSIKAIIIAAHLQKYQMKVSMTTFFQNPTIAEISSYVKVNRRKIDQNIVDGAVPLTPIQHWFFEQDFAMMNHWNQAVLLFSHDELVPEYIEEVFTRILEHHDALRMVYSTEKKQILQWNRGVQSELFQLHVFDLKEEFNEKDAMSLKEKELHRKIDLVNGPLVQLGIYKLNEGHYLQIIIHHLVVDGISWRILLEDIKNGYVSLMNGEEIIFPEKTDSFQKWVSCLDEYSKSRELLLELDYWKRIEDKILPEIPKDDPEPKMFETKETSLDNTFNMLSIEFTYECTDNLLKKANKAYNTEINDLLLVALILTVHQWGGIDRFALDLEGHGREEVIQDIDISRTVSWFTSMYPIVLEYANVELPEQIKLTKERLREIPNKGIGYGILKYLTPTKLKMSNKFKLEPEFSFNYLGQFSTETDAQFHLVRMPYLSKTDFKNSHALHFFSFVANGKLQMILNYNIIQFKESTAQKILEFYQDNLLQVINHCLGREESELTPSDLTYSDLSMEELDELSDLIN